MWLRLSVEVDVSAISKVLCLLSSRLIQNEPFAFYEYVRVSL